MRRDLLLLASLVLLLRLPFLQQPIQGDDVYYLAMARNGLVDPLHPMQMSYVYQGQRVWMAGHSHPALNAYILNLLLRVFGGVHEEAFHACYIVFSMLAVGAVYFLARRFTPRPLAAALLFLAVPSFVLAGNKLEADLPFLALWLAGLALVVYERPLWACAPLALSGLAAYQSVFAAPILAYWFWQYKPGGRWSLRQWPYGLAIVSPALMLAAWQLFEAASAAQLPAAILAGYHTSWNLAGFDRRLRNALALTVHLGWILFPLLAVFIFRPRRWTWTILIFAASAAAATAVAPDYTTGEKILLAASLGTGLCVLWGTAASLKQAPRSSEGFLAAWVLIFFVAALGAFYAGAARYLLPLAAPLALLAARAAPTRALFAGIALQLALSLSLATAYYQFVEQYRDFARRLQPLVGSHRLWFNADWGLRYYLEAIGGEAVLADRPVLPHAVVVSSRLGGAATVQAMGSRRELLHCEIRSGEIRSGEIRSGEIHSGAIHSGAIRGRAISSRLVPFNVIGIESRSGNASADFGLLPFGYGDVLLDEVRAEVIGFPQPTESYLTMASPQAENHLMLGFYSLESGQWRWISRRALAVLLAPQAAQVDFELSFHIPETAPARRVTVELDGVVIASETYPGPGSYTLKAPANVKAGSTVRVEIAVDQTFRVPGDQRELGIIVTSIGLRPRL